jgi:UDP-glucose 4-epimerase
MKRILITGATGFVGRRLLKSLDLSESEVCILSRTINSDYKTIICDFEQDEVPLTALESIDTVFHLAGFAHDMSNASKIKDLYYKINVNSTIQLAKLAVQSGVKKFIFVSSVKAGGVAIPGKCLSENDQGEPEGVYGKTKREAELKLLEISQNSDMHVSIVRPSLVYGPGVKGNLKLMLSGIERGWFPPLPDVRNLRSMVHVDDLVRSILFVSNNKCANREIFIVTDGTPYSSREIYKYMCKALKKRVPKWHVPFFLFSVISYMNSSVRYRVNKLLGDECYSSEKLQSLGFKTQKSLENFNETYKSFKE